MGESKMSKQFTISESQIERAIGVEGRQFAAPCHWLEDVAKQFCAIANLPRGWDSYGSPPPDIRNLKAAWGLLACLCQAGNLPKPHVNPTPDGGVQFDWEEGQRYFEIVVVGERAATYLFCDDEAAMERTGEIFAEDSLDTVVAYVRRVVARTGKPQALPPESRTFVECGRYVERIT
jgi:hypothetical protein